MSGARGENWRGDRIGILGGTFDPPHGGHVRMAAAARAVLGLEHVFWSPAPHPPHKNAEPVTAWEHRRAMTAAALEGEPGMSVTDIESASDPSYTVELLRSASRATPAHLYFILGADSMAELASWREPEEILRLCTLVVFPRDDRAVRLPVPGPASLVVFEAPRVDVSSTEIRAAFAAGAPLAGAVPDAVAAYIGRNGLYRRS